jgi:hypothetical protein
VSTLTIPNTFINGTTINAAPFNQNFGNIVTWSTAIDNTNIGPAGLFPNQLLPTTGAQATFGATAVGVGYKFLANDATAVPLVVSGVSGQSSDLFDVTLTSGGTKAFGVTAAGAAYVGVGPAAISVNGDFSIAESTTIGFLTFGSGTTGQTASIAGNGNVLRFFPQTSAASTLQLAASIMNVTGSVSFNSGNIALTTDFGIARAASTAVMYWGSSATTAGLMDYGVEAAGSFAFRTAAGAFVPLLASAFTVSSDVRLKENVRPISDALATFMKLKPSAFDWIDGIKDDVGFIAQEVESVLPQAVSTNTDGRKGVTYHNITALFAAAFQEYVLAHPVHARTGCSGSSLPRPCGCTMYRPQPRCSSQS